jgi:hypothetical protein
MELSREEMKDRVVVRILQTGSETVVSRSYYERYKNEGVAYIEDYKEPKVVSKAKEA